MKTTKRFDRAVKKLYTAYHNDELDAMDCKHCAVGNLCDNNDNWYVTSLIGDENRVDPRFAEMTGYSSKELAEVEYRFIYFVPNDGSSIGFNRHNDISNKDVIYGYASKEFQKELQFIGLCAVIEYLAELDGIPNPFNLDNLFSNDKKIAEKELQLI